MGTARSSLKVKIITGKVSIDLDALIPKRSEEREVTLGGKTFNVSDVPVGVAAAYLRVRADPSYTLSDAMIDGSVAMLNQGLQDAEKINRSWFLDLVDGVTLEAFCDVILDPFYKRKVMMMTAAKDQAQKTLDQ